MELFRAEHISVSHRAGGRDLPLFEDVSFSLSGGDICDLVGPSGAGKSTLLRACALMMERTAGELFLEGSPSRAFGPCEWRRRVCLVPQKPSLLPGSVRDNLLLPWKLKVRAGGEPPAEGVLRELMRLAELDGVELDRDVARLSGGQQARVALLRAFAAGPEVLLLDEVDAALDDASACAVGRLTRALVGPRMACLRIRHRASDGFAARVFELRGGALSSAAGPAASGDAPCAAGFDPRDYVALQGLAHPSFAPAGQAAGGGARVGAGRAAADAASANAGRAAVDVAGAADGCAAAGGRGGGRA